MAHINTSFAPMFRIELGAAAKAPGLPLSAHSSMAMNHLLLGKKALSRHAQKMAKKAAAPLKSRPEFNFIKSTSN
jgi:hypothetical protein